MTATYGDDDVNAAVRDAADRAGFLFEDFPWRWNGRMWRQVGKADLLRLRMEFSRKAFDVLPDDECDDTVRHEVAHLVVALRYSATWSQLPAHGDDWKVAALDVGARPEATLRKDFGMRARYAVTRSAWCGCGERPVTPQLFRKAAAGKRYLCRTCWRQLEVKPPV